MPDCFDRRLVLASLAGLAAAPALTRAATAEKDRAASGAINEIPLARRLADYVDSIRFADLDGAMVERAKVHLLDCLGCAFASFSEKPVAAVRDLAISAGGNAATIIGTKRRSTLDWAVFANGAAIRADDMNDGYSTSGHPSDNNAVCLAVAEAEGASGADLLLSIVLAYEIECRLLDAAKSGVDDWDHPIYALVGSALAAGKLMRLSRAKLTEAVNIALSGHLSMRQTRLGELANWKGLAGPDAARSSVFSAQLARAGITGPSPIFEGDAGFFKLISGPMDIETARFGNRSQPFKIQDCFIKSYPSQAQTQTAVPPAAKVAQSVGDLKRIRSIEIRTTRSGWFNAGRTPDRFAPETSESADHSLPYIVVRTMLDGTITTGSYSPQALHDPRAVALLKLTTVREDPMLTALAPKKSPTVVSAMLDDGRVVTERVDDLPGFAGRPMQRADVEEKFQRIAKSVIPPSQMARISESVWGLDRARSVGPLIDNLVIPA